MDIRGIIKDNHCKNVTVQVSNHYRTQQVVAPGSLHSKFNIKPPLDKYELYISSQSKKVKFPSVIVENFDKVSVVFSVVLGTVLSISILMMSPFFFSDVGTGYVLPAIGSAHFYILIATILITFLSPLIIMPTSVGGRIKITSPIGDVETLETVASGLIGDEDLLDGERNYIDSAHRVSTHRFGDIVSKHLEPGSQFYEPTMLVLQGISDIYSMSGKETLSDDDAQAVLDIQKAYVKMLNEEYRAMHEQEQEDKQIVQQVQKELEEIGEVNIAESVRDGVISSLDAMRIHSGVLRDK